jgi:hypothetical protein
MKTTVAMEMSGWMDDPLHERAYVTCCCIAEAAQPVALHSDENNSCSTQPHCTVRAVR